MIYTNQRTVEREVKISGIGLHSGQAVNVSIKPAKANTGIVFVKNGVLIPARINFAKSFEFSTTLENKGEKVQTVEHLMAALYFLGIDNVFIEIDADEVPILDGSSEEFVKAVYKAGIKTLPEEKVFAVLTKEVMVNDNDKYIHATPDSEPVFTYEAKYDNKIIGNKKFSFRPFSESFKEVSSARTYCFFEEVEMLKNMGLAKGGSLENAVVFKEECVLNPEGLRFEDEPVRHKLLDLVGDLYLLGYPIIGNIYSYKGGHALNAMFVKKLLKENAFVLKKAGQIKKALPDVKVA